MIQLMSSIIRNSHYLSTFLFSQPTRGNEQVSPSGLLSAPWFLPSGNCVLVNVHVPINGTYTRSKYLGPGSYESSKFVRQGSYLDSFPWDNCAPA
ncbi:hypothetical protein PGT21_026988 [Puccinia graminis f. sp. tritici]|uniref:Uncharacterized protein n=1 Tax=Puccinia graminis f. sp. tritici TaxID=56615 RepID=A0A5B0R208_PUCGR|nr:hypothetical protein PGT21_026988 [Puccinia graminis f. sp. tritici]